MDLADNPMRMVYDALWNMLEASEAFTTAVPRAGNRIKLSDTTFVYGKDTLADADMPEVRIGLLKQFPHLQATSDSSFLTQHWEITISTGDVRFLSVLDVDWAIYRAMMGWETHLKDALEWQSKEFVELCRPLDITETLADQKLSRGNLGWLSVWQGEVRMHFTTSDVAE